MTHSVINLPRVIALSGWKGSGKDTTANYLMEYGYTQLSFASRLKDMVAMTYGVAREDLDLPGKKEIPIQELPAIPTDSFSETIHTLLRSELESGFWTPRALCILEGSIKRSVNSDYWVRSILSEVLSNPYKSYVISDMRYRSEASLLRNAIPDIQLVRIHRKESINTSDPSERDLDSYTFDGHLYNSAGIVELHREIDLLLRKI